MRTYHTIGQTTRQPIPVRDRLPIEEFTMSPDPDGHDWPDGLLAGDLVCTPDYLVGIATHTCPGCPPIPADCLYVGIDGQPTIAYHISQLSPVPA